MRIPQITQRVKEQVVPAYPMEAEITESIGAFAGKAAEVAADFNEKITFKREQDELINAQLGTLEAVNELKLKYKNDPDYATQAERFQKDKDDILQKISPNIKAERVTEEYNNWFREKSLDWDYDIKNQALDLEISHAKEINKDELERAASLGDKGLVHEILARRVASGVLFLHEAEPLERDYFHRIDLEKARGEAKSMGYAAGIPWASSPESRQKYKSVTTDEWKGIEKDLGADRDYEKKLESERHQKDRGEQMAQAQSALWNGELRPSVVKDINELRKLYPDIEDEDQRTLENLYDEMESEAEARAKGKKTESDPAAELEAMNIVLDKTVPKLEKENKIRKLVGEKRLIVDDGWKWLQRVDPSDLERALVEPLQLYIKSKMQDPEAVKDVKNLYKATDAIEKIYEWVRLNPKASLLEGKKYVDDLIGESGKGDFRDIMRDAYELSRKERKELKREEGEKEQKPEQTPPASPAQKQKQAPQAKPPAEAGPRLEENEIIIKDQKTGERFIYNRKTGKKRKL